MRPWTPTQGITADRQHLTAHSYPPSSSARAEFCASLSSCNNIPPQQSSMSTTAIAASLHCATSCCFWQESGALQASGPRSKKAQQAGRQHLATWLWWPGRNSSCIHEATSVLLLALCRLADLAGAGASAFRTPQQSSTSLNVKSPQACHHARCKILLFWEERGSHRPLDPRARQHSRQAASSHSSQAPTSFPSARQQPSRNQSCTASSLQSVPHPSCLPANEALASLGGKGRITPLDPTAREHSRQSGFSIQPTQASPTSSSFKRAG